MKLSELGTIINFLERARRATTSDPDAVSIYFSHALQLYKSKSLNEKDESDFLEILEELQKNPTKSLLEIIINPSVGRPPLSKKKIGRNIMIGSFAYGFNQSDKNKYPLKLVTRKPTNAYEAAADLINNHYLNESLTAEQVKYAYQSQKTHIQTWYATYLSGNSAWSTLNIDLYPDEGD